MKARVPTSRHIHFSLTAAASALCLWFSLVVCAPADPSDEMRAEFIRAYAAAAAQASSQPADSNALRAYPLYPYLESARIQEALVVAPAQGPADEQASAFLKRYTDEPFARDLRRAWLASLARRQLWARYLEEDRETLREDSLRCHALTARIELGRTEGLAAQIIERWRLPRSQPECERAFEWLRGRNELTPALIEERVRAALEQDNTDFARQIVRPLPAAQASPLLKWMALLDSPRREIDALIATPGTVVEPQALLAGWTKLARQDRDAAVARFDRLMQARTLPAAQASRYALALALPLSWDRRAQESLEYFKRVAPEDLDDAALEWKARAALWAGEWTQAAQAIAAMSASQRETARWRYWEARAAQQTGMAARAKELYASILEEDNFHSTLAAARLGHKLEPRLEPLPEDGEALRRLEAVPAFIRARELYLAAMNGFATAEWSDGLQSLPDGIRPQAIRLAARWGWYHQAIATATQERVFNDYVLLYPTPYDSEIRAAAKLSKLDPQLIYSVVRQESLYRSDAVSSAGARGLMQLMPETARRTARAFKLARPTANDLFDPAINVRLGAAHLRELTDRFGGQTTVALAAYNAGPTAARRWLPEQPMDMDIWVENIPYNETRAYVQRILWHEQVFTWLRTGKAREPDREAWLVKIRPRP